jgi:hypothetical protein
MLGAENAMQSALKGDGCVRQDHPRCSLSYDRFGEAGVHCQAARCPHTHYEEGDILEASLVQDVRDPESILNYEVRNESPESFMKNQMTKAYRAEFEKMIVDLKIDRTPAWYSTIVEWKRA